MCWKIKELQLQNFKCHKDLSVPFADLTILTGANASGKSSIIQSILLMEQAVQREGVLRYIDVHDIFGVNLGNSGELISHNPDSSTVTIKITTESYELPIYLNIPNNKKYCLDFSVTSDATDLAKLTWGITNCFYIGAERIGPRIFNEKTGLGPYYVGNNGTNTSYVIDIMSSIDEELKVTNELLNPYGFNFVTLVEYWLTSIFSDTRIRAANRNQYGGMSLLFDNGSGEFSTATNTGFGISYVLPIIVQGLVASAMGRSILIIENPEAHLHPYSQSRIGKFLALIAKTGVQIIVETHSDHFLDGCRIQASLLNQEEDVFTDKVFINYFNHGADPTVIKLNQMGELSEWPAGFFDQASIDLRDLLVIKRGNHGNHQ